MLEIVYISFYGFTLYKQSFYIAANNIQLKHERQSILNEFFIYFISFILQS